MADRSLHNVAADFKAIANDIQIEMDDPGKLLVAARLFDRARDLAEAGSEEAHRRAERLIFPERNQR